MLLVISNLFHTAFSMATLDKTDKEPHKIIYFCSDSACEKLICSLLDSEGGSGCCVNHFDSLNKLKSIDLPSLCDAVLLDIRTETGDVLEAMRWVSEFQCPVALIGVCESYSQVSGKLKQLHLLDDIIVPGSVLPDEFKVRIERAVQSRCVETARRQDQELLSSLLDNVPDAIYFKDRDCRFIRVNAAKANKHGTAPDAMVGQSDFDYFAEEQARKTFEVEQNIMRSGEPVLGVIKKLTFGDGTTRWVNTSKLRLEDKLGRVIGTMCLARDVTELKEAEDKVASKHRLIEAILDNVPDRIFVKDCEGRYIVSNQNHMDFIGVRSEEEVIGTKTFDHFPANVAQKLHDEDMEIIRTRQGLINSYEQRENADGTTSWYLTSKVPLLDDSGACVGIAGVSRDVTKEMNEQNNSTGLS